MSAIEPLLRALLRLIGEVIPTLLLAGVLIVVSANVISRTILREGFQTANELAIVCFSGVVFFGIIGAALNKQMFGVDYFISRLPRAFERPALLLSHLLVIAISGAVLHAATAQVATARFTTFLALGWPKWIVSAGLAFAMGAIIAAQLLHIVILWRRRGE
ncbi:MULTISPECIES: TRAP transporter small permease [Sulfitobacter]|uniref:TRAP transporter small permease protein n=1 Tax=Sulfitobacter profundi TaxID=2679961 RepID=A0ABW1Z361_9RHOB|nr:TRAP transporter small permease subunit [Sulfitobacter indolifex]